MTILPLVRPATSS